VEQMRASKDNALLDIQKDQDELAEVEMRQEAVEDFLHVAELRYEKRMERPLEEQIQHYRIRQGKKGSENAGENRPLYDLTHHALEDELREAKSELAKLNNDKSRLRRNIEKLTVTCHKLTKNIEDKEKAIELDRVCDQQLSIPLVKNV